MKRVKPRCGICGREIKQQEHYFITKTMSLCRECGSKFKGKVNEICNISSSNTDVVVGSSK